MRYLVVVSMLLILSSAACAKWKPAKGPLMTKWAKDVSPRKVHTEYPRPQMVRKQWKRLNGLWEYAIRPKDEPQPQSFDGKILVPFPIESALSGVMKRVGEQNRLWYRRKFSIPKKWAGKRVLVHFGAVDWEANVRVNGKQVGTHRGGYDPFTFDITDALKKKGSQEIVLSVWDPTDKGYQPRGKQVSKPHAIWYTPTTGIWQTAWLEPVPQSYISSIQIRPDVDNNCVWVVVDIVGDRSSHYVHALTWPPMKGSNIPDTVGATGEPGRPLRISLPKSRKTKLWSPDSPHLYDLQILLHRKKSGQKLPLEKIKGELVGTKLVHELLGGEQLVDDVRSYFGMRKISLGKDEKGIMRIMLNNKPQFMYGPLDQGFWPDGIYTAPTDKALRYDIEVLKKLGCNMMRKHVKVESARFYYWCDKLGLLVWQDMPNGEKHVGRKDPDIERPPESAKQFELELSRVIDAHRNHPCIVMWVPFNEGWGQYDTPRIVNLIKKWDPTRLVDNASGWADRKVGDVHDVHKYPGPIAPENEPGRAAVLGEFGGLGLPVKGHTWQDKKNWGYRKYETQQELTDAYLALLEKLKPLITNGLSAAVYTQTTDVEIEVNGLMTYDRAMIKMDAKKITAANKSLYQAMVAKTTTANNGESVPLDIKLPRPMFVGTPQDRKVPFLEKPLGKLRPPFYAPVGTKNVAFEKPVTSTDDEPVIGELEYVTDGDKEAADGSYVELGPFPQSVTIDLGAPYTIYAILCWHYHKQAHIYYDVVVQVADDPDFFTNVTTLFNNDRDNSAGQGIGKDLHYTETNEGKLIDAKGVKARYVRLYSNGSNYDDFNHYIEVEVYGKPAG